MFTWIALTARNNRNVYDVCMGWWINELDDIADNFVPFSIRVTYNN